MVGEQNYLEKFIRESTYVNGVSVLNITEDYETGLDRVEAVYVVSHPNEHYSHVKRALEHNKHVICETPIAIDATLAEELFSIAKEKGCVLMEALKTAYSTAFYRLILLAKSGVIGEIVSVDATCTSLKDIDFTDDSVAQSKWSSLCEWGPIAMLPVFQLLGTGYSEKRMISKMPNPQNRFDMFTKIDFLYPNATATIKVGKGVKSEGELVISGTKGYIYVPAPWWKTDYFEVRYEHPEDNKRFFYQLDGEGIRYEIVAFAKAVESGRNFSYVSEGISEAITGVIEDFNHRLNMIELS
jgi:choline-phosphate cytidylyltransferase